LTERRPSESARTAPPAIRPGLRGERLSIVTESMVTTHAGGARGGVLTTPSMIMLMEETAQEVTRPYLPADHTTVGFEILVRHLAPALLGAELTVTAELVQVDGRKLLFDVSAYNERRKIGEGTLRRTIVRLGALENGER
jgi:fluoroacetyl-CoA thioesterase